MYLNFKTIFNYNLYTSVLGAIIWLLAGIMHYKNQSGIRKTTTLLQLVLLAVAISNVIIVSNNIEHKQGLSSINKILSWTTSSNILYNLSIMHVFIHILNYNFFIFEVLSICLIRKTSDLLSNITTVFLSIGIPYIQLSLNMEVLFMLVLVITLACWRKIVTQSTDCSQSLWVQCRHAFFFVSNIQNRPFKSIKNI